MKINVLSQHSGLSVAIIERIITVLSAHPNLEQAILYGSRAKGNYREGSDIDLTLTGIALNDTELGRIDNELDELLLPYTFDLSLLQQIDNPDLIDHIKRVGIVFYVVTWDRVNTLAFRRTLQYGILWILRVKLGVEKWNTGKDRIAYMI